MISDVFAGACSSLRTFGNISASEIFKTSDFNVGDYKTVPGIFILICFLYFHNRIVCSALFMQQTMDRMNNCAQKFVEFITAHAENGNIPWLSFCRKLFKVTSSAVSVSLLLSTLHYVIYDNVAYSMISFLGLATTLLATNMFCRVDKINHRFLRMMEITTCLLKFAGIFLVIFSTYWIIALYLVCLRQIIKNKLLESLRLIQLNHPSINTNGILQKDNNEMSFQIPSEVIPEISNGVAANKLSHRTSGEKLEENFESHNFLTLVNFDDMHFATFIDYLHRSNDVCNEQENKAHGTNNFETTLQAKECEQIDPSRIINEANETKKLARHVPVSESHMDPPEICNIFEDLGSDTEKREPHFTVLNTNQPSQCLNETFANKNSNQSKSSFKEQTNECELIQKENNQFENSDSQNIEDNGVKELADEFDYGNEQASRKDKLNIFVQNEVPDRHIQKFEHCLPDQNEILEKQPNVLQTTCTWKENFANEPLTSQLDSMTSKENLYSKTKSFVPISSKTSFDSNIEPATKHASIPDLPSGMSMNESGTLCTTKIVPIDENTFNSDVKEVVNRIDLRFIYALK